MLIQIDKPKPTEEMVLQLGGDAPFAQKLVDIAVKNERPQLAAAQDFQERVVARQNERGMKGTAGLGQCIARVDVGLFLRIQKKHSLEIAADSKKFWLVTAPRLYPELGTKPTYLKKATVFSPGKLRTA